MIGSITTRDRARRVLAAVEATRARHPGELARGVSPKSLSRVLAAEEIDVIYRRIRRPARVRGFDGTFVITLRSDLSKRDAGRWALHEYAHVKLGHFDEGDDVVRQLSPCRHDDPRELEARLFAKLLAGGVGSDEPDVVELLVAELEPRAARQKETKPASSAPAPRQPKPDVAPEKRRSAREHERFLAGAGARCITANPATWFTGRRVDADRRSADDEQLTYDPERRTTRFADDDGMGWWLYNYRIVDSHTRQPRRERVQDFMSPTITHRVFVNAAGVRRVYRFRDARERRDYRVQHLERQLREARYL
jgi:hypothetical protein